MSSTSLRSAEASKYQAPAARFHRLGGLSAPKVSVIVPNYNHAPYLRQRLDSIINQTFRDFEVIVLDDASTDNSREIIQTYAHYPMFRFLFNETRNGSAFKQWQIGLENARGRIRMVCRVG